MNKSEFVEQMCESLKPFRVFLEDNPRVFCEIKVIVDAVFPEGEKRMPYIISLDINELEKITNT